MTSTPAASPAPAAPAPATPASPAATPPAIPTIPIPNPSVTVNMPAQQPAQKPKDTSKLWTAIKSEAGAQLVSNANIVGIVAFFMIAIHLYNFFTGFNSVVMRLIFIFITFVLLFFLGANLFWSAALSIFDFLIPTLIVNPFIVKTPSAILYYVFPIPFVVNANKIILDFIIGLLPNWPIETQKGLMLMALVLMPSLVFIFSKVKIEKESKSIVHFFAQIAYILLVIWALLSLASGIAGMQGISAAKTIAQVATMAPEGQKIAAESAASILKAPSTVSKWLSSVYQQQINVATGGEYYAGQVEDTKNKPVGVFIDSLKPGDPVLYSRQPVSVWADLRVATLADNPVTVKTSCTAEDPVKGKIDGTTDPKELVIELTGREMVQCKFKGFEHGSVPVNFTAEFNFQTNAYINAYFMERDRLVALLNENKNPYDLYPVPTRSPTSIFTNGPVKIGMSLESPIGVSTSPKNPMPILGVTLEPGWKGSISSLENVIVYVPEGIELDKESCDHSFESTTSTKTGYKAYKLSDTDPLRKNIKSSSYQTFRCRLKLPSGASQTSLKVLQNEKGQTVPLATKYVFVDTRYTFALVSQLTLNVKEGPEEEQERIAAEKAKLAGAGTGSSQSSAPNSGTSSSTSSPSSTPGQASGTASGSASISSTTPTTSTLCSSFDEQQSSCMSNKESGLNCVSLIERNPNPIYKCRKCEQSLCCATSTRAAGIAFNVDNIWNRCSIDCSKVTC